MTKTRQIHSPKFGFVKVKARMVSDFEFWSFEFVSRFVFRDSDLVSCDCFRPLHGGFLMPPALREESSLTIANAFARVGFWIFSRVVLLI